MTGKQMDNLVKSSPDYTADLVEAHKVWSATRDVIAKALREWGLTNSPEEYAVAILARLAHHNPPILIDFMEETE